MATDIPADDSSGSLGDLSISDEDICDDGALQSDTWIEELECALLADCDPATLKKICEGKRIPATLRPDYWRALLALSDTANVKLTNEYDLSNQDELRRDCELLVEDISTNLAQEPLPDADKLRLKSDFESTLTTYVKARPELRYVSGNGWTDILRVLYNLQLSDTQLYQMFFRIVDRYIPRDLSPSRSNIGQSRSDARKDNSGTPPSTPINASLKSKSESSPNKQVQQQTQQSGFQNQHPERDNHEKSVQAYQLLRLLIQYHDPELCSILDSRKVTPNLYVKDWFCSLFARSCEPKLALHIWDMHFKMADPFLIFFAAIVMVVNASDELKKGNLNQGDMLNVLKKMPSQLEEDDVEDLYYLVSNHYTNSTPRSIRSYSHLFFMDTFGATYSGNESPEDGGSPTFVDLKTCRLTSSLDLSQYLCLPIVPAEIFAMDTAQKRSSPTNQSSPSNSSPASSALRYFLVDCRPAEQYNAGHLTKAFHLDCSLMLREPSSFATAVQALLEIQRQVVASKSNTGGQHLCFIGSGQDEEDCYVNMVVASFLQKYQKYVSIVFGGFDAIHDYVQSKSELKNSFDKYVVDHNEELCKACCSKSPEGYERLRAHQEAIARSQKASAPSGFSSAQSIFASTTNFFKSDKGPASAISKFTASNPQATATAQQLAQSGASMFDKFTTAFVSKSSVFKERLVETLNSTTLPTSNLSSGTGSFATSATRSHVDSHDKLGRRYTGGSFKCDDMADLAGKSSSSSLRNKVGHLLSNHHANQEDSHQHAEEPLQEIQIEQWQKENKILALYKCAQIKGSSKFPGYIGLNKSHLWILREIPHNKGFASIAAKRPLDMVVQITSKRRQPDFIIFRYGYANTAGRAGNVTSDSNNDESARGSPGTQSPDNVQSQVAGLSQPQTNSTGKSETAGQQKGGLPTIIASDHLHIPQAFEVIRLIKREIVRIMDESSRKASVSSQVSEKRSETTSVEMSTTEQSNKTAEGAVQGEGTPGVEAPGQKLEQFSNDKESRVCQEESSAAQDITTEPNSRGEQDAIAKPDEKSSANQADEHEGKENSSNIVANEEKAVDHESSGSAP